MAGPETNLKIAVGRYLTKLRKEGHPLWFMKTHGGGRTKRGNPDLDIVFYGFAVRIELKAPGEEPTKIQERRLAEIESAGGLVGVADSLREVKAILRRAIERRKQNNQAIFKELD